MGISGINSGGDNPFLKKMQDDISGLGFSSQINKDEGNLTVTPNEGSKVDKTGDVKKTNEEGAAAQANVGGQQQNLIDKSQFTNENDIQEIDLEEFEDDM